MPDRESLKTRMEHWAKENGTSLKKELDFYIKGRIGDIKDSTEIILREQQRIKKAKQCINMALSLMMKGASDQAKSVIKQFYKDTSIYAIGESRSKLSK